jgi:hypothetical protein
MPKIQRIDLNEVAREITLEEGGKINLSEGQVKEVLRLVLTRLASRDLFEVAQTLIHYKNKQL